MVRSWTAAFELPLLPSAGDDDKNQDVPDHMISVEAQLLKQFKLVLLSVARTYGL